MNSQFMLALAASWVLLEIIMVMAEETDLVIRFGDSYIKYRTKTGMFFPRNFLNLGFLDPVKESISDLLKPNDD